MKRQLRSGFFFTLIMTIFLLNGLGYCHADHGSFMLNVYIKDEGFQEKNIVKPRIYVKNIGNRRVTSFDLFYYFTVENEKKPVVETYYTPGSDVKLNRVSKREYCVCYRFRQVEVNPGDIYPNKDGNSIGIHYDDWSPMDKRNDYSNPGSSSWRLTQRVDVKILDSKKTHTDDSYGGGKAKGDSNTNDNEDDIDDEEY